MAIIDFIKRTKKKVDDFIPDINRQNIQRATSGIVNRATQIRNTLPVYQEGRRLTDMLERQKQEQERRNQERRQREEQQRIARMERERVARDQQRAREQLKQTERQQARENQARIQRERANQPQESLLSRGKKLGGAFINAYLEQPTIQNVNQRRLDAKVAEDAFNQSTKLQEEAMKTTDQNRRQRLLKVADQIKQPYVGQVGKDKNLKPQEFVKAGAELNFTLLPFVPGMNKGSLVKAGKALNTANKLNKAQKVVQVANTADKLNKTQKASQTIKLLTGAGQATSFVDDISTLGKTKALRNLLGRNLAQATTQAGVNQIPTPETKDMSLQDRAIKFGTDVALGTAIGTGFEAGIGGGIKLAEKGIKRLRTPKVKLTPTETTPQTKTPAREAILAQIEEATAPKTPTTPDFPTTKGKGKISITMDEPKPTSKAKADYTPPKKGGTPFDEVEPTPTPRKADPKVEAEIARLAEPSKKDVEVATQYATTINPNDPFGNSNWINELRNNLGSAYDSDYKMLKLLRKVEQETGQVGLEDNFYRATDAVRKSQQIATAKVQDDPNLNKAYQGLSGREAKEFDDYIKAEKRLAREPISEDTTKLTQIVQSGQERFGERTQALREYYKGQAQLAREANLIDDFTYRAILDSPDYTAMERKLNEVLGQQYVRPRGERGKPKEKASSTQAINMASRLEYNKNKNIANTQIKDTLESIGLAKQVDEASESTITVYVNGEKQHWKVPADVMDVVKTMDRQQLSAIAQIISVPNRIFRALTTGLQPAFAIPAYIMDLAGSAIVSKNVWATHNPKVIIEGLFETIKTTATGKRSPMWQKFEQMGLSQTLYDDLRNARTAEALERQLRKGTAGRLENAVKNPIRTLEDIVAIGEKAIRYQNFAGTYRNAIKNGLSETEAYKQAYLASAKNSVNFARGSNFTRTIGLAIPYFGARVQGARQLLESFRDRPIPTTIKSLAIVGLPQVASILLAYSDPKTREVYNNISQDEKDRNLIFVSPDAKQDKNGVWEGVWKLPKPPGFRELWQPLADLTEQFAGGENDKDIKAMLVDMLEAVSPVDLSSPERFASSVIPQQVKPTVEAYLNKNLYFNNQIVPDYMIEQTDDPTKRTKESTSGGVELLAKQLNMSPLQLEKFIGSTLGTGGRQLINLVDTGLASAGIIDKEKIGGKSVLEGVQTRFNEARGRLLPENKTPGQRYFDARKEATQGLTAKELEVYNTLNPSKTNFLGEEIFDENKRLSKYTRAGLYLQYPNVLEADRKLNLIQVQNGNPANPLFGLADDKLAKVLLKEALPPGAKDPELSKLNQQDWYREYQAKRGKFFDEVKLKLEREGKPMAPQENPYPSAPANIQRAMDTYFALPEGRERNQWKKANPQLWEAMRQQWELQDLWEDKERVKIGLAEVNEPLTPPKTPTIRLRKASKPKEPKAPRALSTLMRGQVMSKDIPKVKGSLALVRLKGSKKLPTLKLKATSKKAPTLKLTKSTTPKPLSTKKIRIKTSKIK